MSHIEKIAMLDPRIDMSASFRKWYTMLGSPNVVNQVYPTSSFSNSNCTFNIPLPDADRCVIDRSSVVIAMPIRLVLVGPNSGSGNVYNPSYEGLRSEPLMKVINQLTIQMNGSSLNYYASEQAIVMERFNDNRNKNQMIPTMPDYTQTYALSNGTNRSPFASYLDNVTEMSRRGYPLTVVGSVSPTTMTIDTVLFWNLFDIPPFSENPDVMGINLTPFSINMSYNSQLARIWSRDIANHPQTSLTSLTVTMGTNSLQSYPTISMNVLSLPSNMKIPRSLTYPYHQVVFNSQLTGSLAQYASVTNSSSQIIQLNTVPSKIYIYVKPSTQFVNSTAANAYTYPDIFASIQQVSITFGNKNNLLSTMTPAQLFGMSKRNGLSSNIGYPDFIGYAGANEIQLMGSVICIDPMHDLSLEEGFLVGSNTKINFQTFISYTALHPTTSTYDLCTLFVYDGLQTMQDGQCNLNTTVINNINELQQSQISYNEMQALYGGMIAGDFKSFMKSSFGKIKEIAGPINDILRETKLISKIAPMIPYVGSVVAPVARSLGYGEEYEGGDFYAQNNNRGGFIAGNGGILAGGKQLPRSVLQKQINKYR